MALRKTRRKLAAGGDGHEEGDTAQPRDNTLPTLRHKPRSSNKPEESLDRAARSASSKPSPQKVKAKAKSAISTPPKPTAKPIYSFFNAAVQRQQTDQPVRSLDKSSVLYGDVEAIHDDSDDERGDKVSTITNLSQGSSTALAMRKRKFQRTQSVEEDITIAPSASQKFRKGSAGERVAPLPGNLNDARPWTERFMPNDLSELAVHKRKVSDVRDWLQTTLDGRRQKVLVLKGAAGTGKTMTVRLLAKDLGIDIVEWTESTLPDYASDEYVSATARFEEFVARASSSTGLTLFTNSDSLTAQVENENSSKSDYPQLLMIEEFPNTFSKTSSAMQSFRSIIAQYVSTTVPAGSLPVPMVMIVSETLLSTNTAAADSFTAHRLLGPELNSNPYINTIEFNSVAPTFLVKALELVVVKEARKSGRRKTPGPQVLKRLAETGDIRSAVSSLEFLCLRGDQSNTWSSKVTFTKPKHAKTPQALTEAEEEALRLITNRESSLGIFHSVGKVVYNKRTNPVDTVDAASLPPWLANHHRSKTTDTDPDTLLDELGTDTSTFISALHENYALSCTCASPDKSLDSLLGCVENLSDSDLLSLDRLSFGTRAFSGSAADTMRQDEMCFQVAVRGMLFELPHPVHRGTAATGNKRADAHRMLYPASLRLWRKQSEIVDKLELLLGRLSDGSTTGVANRGASQATSSTGVQSWKHHKLSGATSNAASDVDVHAQSSANLRNEMLMDRLPYLSQILATQTADRAKHILLDEVLAVTRVPDASSAAAEDNADEAGEDEEDDTAANATQWSTDRPDGESGVVAKVAKKPFVSKKQKPVFEAMSIPVETQVEKLVLEDDDIVDD